MLNGDKTLTKLAQQDDVHGSQVTDWKRPLLERAGDVFGNAADKVNEEPDLKTLHVKIGQLILENDFLSGALTKAGLLSAKKVSTVAMHCRCAGNARCCRCHTRRRTTTGKTLAIIYPMCGSPI